MQRNLTRALAVIAALGLLVAIPAAAIAKASKTDKSQNKTLKTQGKSIKSLRKSSSALGKSTKSATSAIAALKIIADRGDKNAKTVLDAAPAILKALTDLKDGLTAAGTGLTSLKTLATSQEYGIAQVSGEAGTFLETPDIPDTVQQAQVSRQFTATVAGPVQETVAYGVRSNEGDGDGTVAAANCRVTVANATGVTESTTGGPVGNGFLSVLTKSTLTSTTPANAGFPFGLKTAAPDADVTQNFTTAAVPVAAGERYTVTLACVDLTPDANDPGA
jgi:hypothetical protein